ncbi:hypothetical protein J437_LFUL007607 [Ladona fulva]|uniref:DNA topoisomerase (ATP-hydrolyzing) n=1 Tax=Ladona fulva TaxID=123851 RepID=A0A8K0K7X5_LADFU|nr:hypothetical protein J437_LFUL007607 [Ladona fulva]
MIEELMKKGYDSDPVKNWKMKQNKEEVLNELLEDSQPEETDVDGVDYDYLLGMTMWSLTKERKDELLKKRDEKQQELRILQAKPPSQLWREDLDAFLEMMAGLTPAKSQMELLMNIPLTKLIYHPHDEPLLNHLKDDNLKIEPEYYMPIIPMLLVNGADGIGTGWMTKIPNYNPREIANNIKRLLDGEEPVPMKPWYKNFLGTVDELAHQRHLVSGVISILGPTTLEITELPVGTDYKEYNTDTSVRFVVSMSEEKLAKAEEEGLHKMFKLQTQLSSTSMVCFDHMGCLRKFDTVQEILKQFYDIRLEYYVKRKAYLEGMLQSEALKLSNQARD